MKFFGIFDECCNRTNLTRKNNDYFQCNVCKRIFIISDENESDKHFIKRIEQIVRFWFWVLIVLYQFTNAVLNIAVLVKKKNTLMQSIALTVASNWELNQEVRGIQKFDTWIIFNQSLTVSELQRLRHGSLWIAQYWV